MNEENNVNQETEEKKEVVETASVAEEKKVESTEIVDKEKEEKSKKAAKGLGAAEKEVFDTTSDMVLSEVVKIVGRELTDDEKKKLGNSLKVYFVMTSLMMGCACK